MDSITTRTYKGEQYVNANDLPSVEEFGLSHKSSAAKIVEKMEVPDDQWMEALYGENMTLKTPLPTSKKTKTYIKLEWLIKNLKSQRDRSDPSSDSETENDRDDNESDEEIECVEAPTRRTNTKVVSRQANRSRTTGVTKAPPIIDIPKCERMLLPEGKRAVIETRGSRSWRECYFLASDIGKSFRIEKIRNTIRKKKYVPGRDYNKFRVACVGTKGKKVMRSRLYLTMMGVIRILAKSHSDSVIPFMEWSTDLVFTALMGTNKDRARVASKLTGIAISEVQKSLKKSTSAINGLYFIQVGTFGSVKGDFDIEGMINENTDKPYKDGDVVIKIGMASDIGKRLGQHNNKLGKLVKSELEIINFAAVNPYVTSEAETALKKKLAKIGTLVPGYREVYVVDQKSFGKSIDKFRDITEKYPGDFNGLARQVQELTKANKSLRAKYNASKRDVEVLEEKLQSQKEAHEKEVASLKKEMASREKAHEKEIASLKRDHKKDLEIANLRTENLRLQLIAKTKRR